MPIESPLRRRLALCGLVLVLLLLALSAIAATSVTQDITGQVNASTVQQGVYQQADRLIALESAQQQQYVENPQAAVLSAFYRTASSLTDLAQRIDRNTHTGARSPVAAGSLVRMQQRYFAAAQRLIAATKAGDGTLTTAIDNGVLPPLVHAMDGVIATTTLHKQQQVLANLQTLDRAQTIARTGTIIIFVLGLALLTFLWSVYQRAGKRTERRFRALSERASDLVAIVDAGGIVHYASPSCFHVLGYRPEDLVGHGMFDFIHDDDQAGLGTILTDTNAQAGEIRTAAFRVRDSDGAWRWVEATWNSFLTDPAVRGIIISARDITERMRAQGEAEHARTAAEEHARESEALAQVSVALAGSLEPERIYQVILEQAARVLPCDHAAVTLCGDGQVTFVATWGEPRIPAGAVYHTDQVWLPVAGGGVAYVADTNDDPHWHALPPLDGPYNERSLLSAPLTLDGTLIGSFDVSSRTPHFYNARHRYLAAEFAARATQALGNARLFAAEQARVRAAERLASLQRDFVASVSHELRTPLTAVIGFGELLQAHWGQMSEERRLVRIDQIVLAANRQKRLVEDLLLASRLEGANLIPRREAFRLKDLVAQAVGEIRSSYPGQIILLEGPADLHLRADGTHTVQVLTNLVDNAAKYSPEGSPITVCWDLEAGMVALRVIDHGAGVPGEGRDQLFTRFGRLQGSAIRGGRVGTGLGLFISRGLAEAMGGSLDMETTGPGGSTFRLRLPGGVSIVPAA